VCVIVPRHFKLAAWERTSCTCQCSVLYASLPRGVTTIASDGFFTWVCVAAAASIVRKGTSLHAYNAQWHLPCRGQGCN
jgi:hypothetical protein